MKDPQNYHVLKIKMYPATNNSDYRVGIISERFRQRVTVLYNHNYRDISGTAIDWLEKQGFNIIGKAESKEGFYIITDTFEPLRSEK